MKLDLGILATRQRQRGLSKDRAEGFFLGFEFAEQLTELYGDFFTRIICERQPDVIWSGFKEKSRSWMWLDCLYERFSYFNIRINRELLKNGWVIFTQLLAHHASKPSFIEKVLR